MEIEDLYINSDRLIANIDLTHKRYLYYTINWNHRMECIAISNVHSYTGWIFIFISFSSTSLYSWSVRSKRFSQ